MKKVKRGERFKIDFFVKASGFRLPLVTAIKFNNAQICPENEQFNQNGESKCAKFEKTDSEIGGRWDGVLTVYPLSPRNGIRVDIELNEAAWALGVSFLSNRFFFINKNLILERLR